LWPEIGWTGGERPPFQGAQSEPQGQGCPHMNGAGDLGWQQELGLRPLGPA
jgi:hypothetical protein